MMNCMESGVGAGPVPARCPQKGQFSRINRQATVSLTGHRAGTGACPYTAGKFQIVGNTL